MEYWTLSISLPPPQCAPPTPAFPTKVNPNQWGHLQSNSYQSLLSHCYWRIRRASAFLLNAIQGTIPSASQLSTTCKKILTLPQATFSLWRISQRFLRMNCWMENNPQQNLRLDFAVSSMGTLECTNFKGREK